MAHIGEEGYVFYPLFAPPAKIETTTKVCEQKANTKHYDINTHIIIKKHKLKKLQDHIEYLQKKEQYLHKSIEKLTIKQHESIKFKFPVFQIKPK